MPDCTKSRLLTPGRCMETGCDQRVKSVDPLCPVRDEVIISRQVKLCSQGHARSHVCYRGVLPCVVWEAAPHSPAGLALLARHACNVPGHTCCAGCNEAVAEPGHGRSAQPIPALPWPSLLMTGRLLLPWRLLLLLGLLL